MSNKPTTYKPQTSSSSWSCNIAPIKSFPFFEKCSVNRVSIYILSNWIPQWLYTHSLEPTERTGDARTVLKSRLRRFVQVDTCICRYVHWCIDRDICTSAIPHVHVLVGHATITTNISSWPINKISEQAHTHTHTHTVYNCFINVSLTKVAPTPTLAWKMPEIARKLG